MRLRQSVPLAVGALAAAGVIATVPSAAAVPSGPGASGDASYRVALTPDQVPGGGADSGAGEAQLRLDPEAGKACYDISWAGLAGQVVAVHLHRGAPGQAGPHHIDFFDGASLPGDRGSTSGCADAGHGGHHGGDSLRSEADPVRAVIDNPQGFYLNLHTTRHEKGAIRGQLG